MSIHHVLAESNRAAALAFLGFGLSIAFTMLIIYLLVISNISIIYARLFRTILGGSSSITVGISLVKFKRSKP